MKNLMMRLWKEEEGQDLTEYALLLTLIALVSIATINTLGKTINNVFTNTVNGFTATT
jgi:pilus assembly protein Flp/PilA